MLRGMPDLDLKPTSRANPMTWGAVGAIVCAAGVAVLSAFPSLNVSGTSTVAYSSAVGAGFIWGMGAAALKNWLGRNIHKP